MASKNIQNQWIVHLATLGIGALLGYTYYHKRTTQRQPSSKSKSNSSSALTINTNNIELPTDIDEYFSIALSAAHEAGELINKFINDKQSKSDSLSTKSNVRDLVTQFDKNCEQIIVTKIKSAFPTHRFIAEESYSDSGSTRYNITNDLTWFIDPIDGTTNFVHAIPLCCVSIGLRFRKIPILGIVHCPLLNETFHAMLGRGSFVTNHKTKKTTKLQTNGTKFDNDEAMKQAIILMEASSNRSEKTANGMMRRMHSMLYGKEVRAIRMLGTCAIDMCWIAMGRADIYFGGRNNKIGPKPWDFTAGEVIVSEAGGITCLPEGKVFDCTQGRVLCCNNIETAQYVVAMALYKPGDI